MPGRKNWKEMRAKIMGAPFVNGKLTMVPARPLIDGRKARRLVNRLVRNSNRSLIEKTETATRPNLRLVIG